MDEYYFEVNQYIKSWNGKYQRACEHYPFIRFLPQDQVIELVVFSPKVVHLLISLFNHPEISRRTKLSIGSALGYFISPIDLIPEMYVGPVGYVDDVEVALNAIDKILSGNKAKEKNVINDVWQGTMRELERLRSLCEVLSIVHRLKKMRAQESSVS